MSSSDNKNNPTLYHIECQMETCPHLTIVADIIQIYLKENTWCYGKEETRAFTTGGNNEKAQEIYIGQQWEG